MDHALDDRDDIAQETVFLEQLELSRRLNRPVCIHCRRAWGRLQAILESLGPHPRGMLIHAFSGAPDLIPGLARLNAYFSFSGAITSDKNRRGQRSLQQVPEDRLLLETDAPDMPPEASLAAARSPNEPSNLPLILRHAAALRSTPAEKLAEQTWRNACALFGISVS